MDTRHAWLILLCLFGCLFTGCTDKEGGGFTEDSSIQIISDPGPRIHPSVAALLDAIQSGEDWLSDGADIDNFVLIDPIETYCINNIYTYPNTSYTYYLHSAASCVNDRSYFPYCDCGMSLAVDIEELTEEDIQSSATWDYFHSSSTEPFVYMEITYTKRQAAGKTILFAIGPTGSMSALWFEGNIQFHLSYAALSGDEQEPDLTVEGELEKLVGAVAGFRTIPMEEIRLHGKAAAE